MGAGNWIVDDLKQEHLSQRKFCVIANEKTGINKMRYGHPRYSYALKCAYFSNYEDAEAHYLELIADSNVYTYVDLLITYHSSMDSEVMFRDELDALVEAHKVQEQLNKSQKD